MADDRIPVAEREKFGRLLGDTEYIRVSGERWSSSRRASWRKADFRMSLWVRVLRLKGIRSVEDWGMNVVRWQVVVTPASSNIIDSGNPLP